MKNKEVPLHIEYLDELDQRTFRWGSGRLVVVHIPKTFEEAHILAENDPHVAHSEDMN
ncbi:hypothetical protein P4534_20670 [Peribacillus butanolivorans]|uniref:hypothetical protein n=1 Tax=Peribacillus butanolivorans TaxID=421767 RepID=UPI002E22A9A8|nr:hypothetical protein [Peribacillus butanolivorans]